MSFLESCGCERQGVRLGVGWKAGGVSQKSNPNWRKVGLEFDAMLETSGTVWKDTRRYGVIEGLVVVVELVD